jgi:hypothetical protein
MSEPISAGAAGAAGWKLLGGLAGMGAIGAGLAAFVAMSLTKPRTDQEWRVALVCTIAGSIGGGSCLVSWLGIQHWARDPFGLAGMFGLAFACGLPAWAVVRWIFNYIGKRQDADIADVVKEVKGIL